MRAGRWYYPLLALPLAAASGVLFAFAVPPRQISFLGWFAFVPLLIAARTSRPLIAAGCGMICSLVAAMVLAGHVEEANQYGNLIAVFGSLGLVFAFVAGSASVGKKLSPAVAPFFVACAGVTAELLSVSVFPVNVAISQYRVPAMLRLASVTGIWGVSFLLWLVPASIIELVRKPRSAWPARALSAMALVAASCVGFAHPGGGRMLRVAAIQAADPYSAARKTRDMRDLAEIAVWPEHRIEPGPAAGIPSKCARENRIAIIADIREPRPHKRPYNTAVLYAPSERAIAKQRKRFPFGDENFVFSRGSSSDPANCGSAHLGMAICFDTQFSVVIRDLARRGADVVFVPIHDPEMPNSLLNYLHSAVVTFRAAENGIPVVCAECYGLSSIIDGSGRIVARSPAGTGGAVFAPVRLRSATTIATRWGDWFGYLCALGMAGSLVLASRKRAK